MPLYRCVVPHGAVSQEDRPKIAREFTRIHCEVTAAPETFVHVFFFDADPSDATPGQPRYLVNGSIRAGRTDEQKQQIKDQMTDAFATITGVDGADIAVSTIDVPASWVMEGGTLLPEPGEEEAWLAAHHADAAK